MTEHRGKRFKTAPNTQGAEDNVRQTQRAARFKQSDLQAESPSINTAVNNIPQPIATNEPFTVSPEVSGVLPKLDAGEGAVVPNRKNAASTTGSFPPVTKRGIRAFARSKSTARIETQQRNPKKTIALISGLAVIFIAIMFIMFSSPSEDVSRQPVQPPEERVKVAQDGEVEFRDFIFSLAESNNKWELIGRPKGQAGDIRKYVSFEGKPVSLILFEGGFIIPENLPHDKWDVVAYSVSDGSVVSRVLDTSGNPVGGNGKVKSAEIAGDDLKLTFESGEQKSFNLR